MLVRCSKVLYGFSETVTAFQFFEQVANLDNLVTSLVHQSNLYAQQNGRQFESNNEGMMAFLCMNYIMRINRLPSVKDYWQVDEYIGNDAIRNVMPLLRFMTLLQNLQDDGTDKG